MPSYWTVSPTGRSSSRSSATSAGNGAISNGSAGKRRYVGDVVLRPMGRAVGLGRPYALPNRAGCPIGARIAGDVTRPGQKSARVGLRQKGRLGRLTSTGRGHSNRPIQSQRGLFSVLNVPTNRRIVKDSRGLGQSGPGSGRSRGFNNRYEAVLPGLQWPGGTGYRAGLG